MSLLLMLVCDTVREMGFFNASPLQYVGDYDSPHILFFYEITMIKDGSVISRWPMCGFDFS